MAGKDSSSSWDGPPLGEYGGPLRPRVHFSPPAGFMNDPNGCLLLDDTFHLYYQYNPTGLVAGNVHWGHATSKDLYRWTNEPIVLPPVQDNTNGYFTGSCVVDWENTSGFFPDQKDGIVALYTMNVNGVEQRQDIAYSRDGGRSFQLYEGNPVISLKSRNFRDPKVIWHGPTRRWVMAVVLAQEFVVQLYVSKNLKEWEHTSDFANHGLTGLQVECPNLVELAVEGGAQGDPATMWLMLVSIQPGAPLGGSATLYYPGTFDGRTFTPTDATARIADFAKDNYATQFFEGVPLAKGEKALSIAWASNWQYTSQTPTGELEGWRSTMSLPRHNWMQRAPREGWTLFSYPAGLSSVLDKTLVDRQSVGGNGALTVPLDHPSKATYFKVAVRQLPPADKINHLSTFKVVLRSPAGDVLRMGQLLADDPTFYLDRGRCGKWGEENPFFTDKFSVHFAYPEAYDAARGNEVTIEGVIDRSIVEVFLQGGMKSGTSVVYPEEPFSSLEFEAGELDGGVRTEVTVVSLVDAWR